MEDSCNIYNPATGECEKCYQGFYISKIGCRRLNPLCRTGDEYGKCTSCYNLYVLNDGDCKFNP